MEIPFIRITRREGGVEHSIEIGTPPAGDDAHGRAIERWNLAMDRAGVPRLDETVASASEFAAASILPPIAPAPAPAPALEWSAPLNNGERLNFADAEKACAALGDGWRLPTRAELESILDLSRHDPAIDIEKFPDTQSGYYWTSTPCAWAPSYAWVVYFDGGDVDDSHRDFYAFVRAVRSAPAGQ